VSNGCPVCLGLGYVLIVAATVEPAAVACPECAGLLITPASAEDDIARDPVAALLRRIGLLRPALPASVTQRAS